MPENVNVPARPPTLRVNGAPVWQGLLDKDQQTELLHAVLNVAQDAPFFRPVTPSGRPMSVEMTSAGDVGWITDRQGYRYQPLHPGGEVWPPIPELALAVWGAVAGVDRPPSSCLINRYREESKMGLHQDRDEGDLSWPVVSISLGDAALFRVGGTERKGKTQSVWLSSGDVVVLTGETRLAYHGIDRVRGGSSTVVPGGGRINLTMRVVS
ncbi:MAG: alpha-ketoglutarate-dependent dioxygenase AlkB [Pseudomonadota bacterium]